MDAIPGRLMTIVAVFIECGENRVVYGELQFPGGILNAAGAKLQIDSAYRENQGVSEMWR